MVKKEGPENSNTFVDRLEQFVQSFSTDKSVQKVNSQYKVHAHENKLSNTANSELDLWVDNDDE